MRAGVDAIRLLCFLLHDASFCRVVFLPHVVVFMQHAVAYMQHV